MLAPKKVKWRKQQKGKRRGISKGATTVAFGEYGLQALSPGFVTSRQIEAARIAISRHVKRGGKLYIRIFPDKPISKKPAETRMGHGKGNPEEWVALAVTHSGLGRLLGDRLVRKDPDVELATALDVAGDGDTR